MNHQSEPITHWLQFSNQVRSKGCNLLKRLDDFPNAVLVTGCQRSGTTILSRIITESDSMVNYWFGPDDELDAALILSGTVSHIPQGRYCFQTTYLNNCYHEYFEHTGYKIIWVLRNPHSVIYSLLYNWKSFAFDELFQQCGTSQLTKLNYALYTLFGKFGVNRLKQACLSYNGKVSQLFELKRKLASGKLMVIDYDELVQHKETILPNIYQFIDLTYKPEYANKIHTKSVNKADQLSNKEAAVIEKYCWPVYKQARQYLTGTTDTQGRAKAAHLSTFGKTV